MHSLWWKRLDLGRASACVLRPSPGVASSGARPGRRPSRRAAARRSWAAPAARRRRAACSARRACGARRGSSARSSSVPKMAGSTSRQFGPRGLEQAASIWSRVERQHVGVLEQLAVEAQQLLGAAPRTEAARVHVAATARRTMRHELSSRCRRSRLDEQRRRRWRAWAAGRRPRRTSLNRQRVRKAATGFGGVAGGFERRAPASASCSATSRVTLALRARGSSASGSSQSWRRRSRTSSSCRSAKRNAMRCAGRGTACRWRRCA